MSEGRKKSARPTEDESLIAIARAVRTRGLKGEIVADLLTDFPDRFDKVSRLVVVSPEGERRTVQLENHWFQKGRIVLKLSGCDTVESASTLVGCQFAVPEAERVVLADDQYYDWELEGCKVETVTGQQVGVVKSVTRTGGVDLLVVDDEKEHSSLIPMVSSIVTTMDIGKRTILIDPPEGLLDL